MAYQLNLPATLRRGFFVSALAALLLVLQATAVQSIAAADTASTKTPNDSPALSLTSNTPPEPSPPPRTCNSIEVRSRKDFALLQNCTRVMGHVTLAQIQLTAVEVVKRQFVSKVEEISDYLLVHRVHGLETLQYIFPKLIVIRGRHLLFDEFALVVHENRDLSSLGLASLMRIQKGNIRIENNPNLCYVDTVNWVQLLGNSTQQHFWHKKNKFHNHCSHCPRTANEIAQEEDLSDKLRKHCWNFDLPQLGLPTDDDNCRRLCGDRSCDKKGNCCDRNCLSDCDGMKCRLCANLNYEKQCVDSCPSEYYEYQERDCITALKCRKLGLIPHAGSCIEKCPKNYVISFIKDQKSCKQLCNGKYIINTVTDIESLRGCSKIVGSLTIELTDMKIKINHLDAAFSNVTEITGYLKVVNSPQLLSLHFLRNLITIRGEELIDDLYALIVVDNFHLSEIWAPNQNVAILKGSIYFHLNPRLCLYKIRELQKSIRSETKPINTVNASPHSNGERVVCSSAPINLTVTVEDFNSTAVRLKIDIYLLYNIQVILGYVYYYKEAPIQNVTYYDGRHGCGHDSWHMKVNPSKNIRYILTNLKPATQYAYFVKTLTMTNYHMQMDGYSPIQYFSTLPSKPGAVTKIYYSPLSLNKIVLHWWPPKRRNGVIDRYLIYHEETVIAKSNITLGNHPEFRRYPTTCECDEVQPEDSGPLPDDANYYDKGKIVYEETLPNLLFVTGRRIANSRVRREISDTPNTLKSFWRDVKRREISDENVTTEKSTPNDKILSKEEQMKKDDHDLQEERNRQGEELFNRFMKQQEENARNTQDTGTDDFPIIKQRPICPLPDASVQYQLQNNCQVREMYRGIVVPGDVHSYVLENLQPDITYRITIRACVADLTNSCGTETVIYAETVSKSMQAFIAGLKGPD
ncbi:insulin receptor isoform X2 [Ceratitis capitata]|uniref:insulin receptor isoform X2 n=1 Tax=Ceratitis capitata TaxID=7213 RepID=UPI000A0F9DC2|nr:insulin receptor isoform X2 [Ceratitis capitata]